MKKTKIILVVIISFAGFISNGQTAIGKTSVTNASCLLEFGSDARGIRLPLVSDVATITGATPGTIAFDTATGSFRYYNGSNWGTATTGGVTGGAPAGLDEGGPVIIGATTTTATAGALVLEATDKALVLPSVVDSGKIPTPTVGLMLWDSLKKQVAVYDGAEWKFY